MTNTPVVSNITKNIAMFVFGLSIGFSTFQVASANEQADASIYEYQGTPSQELMEARAEYELRKAEIEFELKKAKNEYQRDMQEIEEHSNEESSNY